MQRLFDPDKHEALTAQRWDDAGARAAIEQIAAESLAAFSPTGTWPMHPLDDPLPRATGPVVTPARAGLYDGAAGVIWTLRQLAARGLTGVVPDFAAVASTLPERYREWELPEPNQIASFLIGDAGLLLLRWQIGREGEVADRIHATVENNLDNPTREALWGNPGSALAALHMAEATAEPRWKALLGRTVQKMVDTLETDPETGTPIWTQAIDGHRVRYLGAGHGLAGNVYLAMRAAALIDATSVQLLSDAALATLQATALHDGDGGINWHPMSDRARVVGRVPLVQDCHGAPGIILRLAGMPRSEAWDTLLLGAAELTWRAGPLAKGPGLCHGTSGSALALLRFAQRSGQEVWRERARALAWHAAKQVQRQHQRYGCGRHALWTGDLGVAWVLAACLEDDARLPVFDVFF
jgi:hypothetical protein